MAFVYVLKSAQLNRYYTGSCLNLEERFAEHLAGKYSSSFTSKASDWEVFLALEGLTYLQSRDIEMHIKRMKSSKYIENLKRYPEMHEQLIRRYAR